MSRSNISSMIPTTEGLYVPFVSRGGGTRTYFYDDTIAVAQILAGDDPAQFAGQLVLAADAPSAGRRAQ